IGRPGYITLGHDKDLATRTDPSALEQHAHAMLDTARAAGVKYIDAARSYGRAEQFLGTWLDSRQAPLGQPIVGSKWGYVYEADWKIDAEVHEVKVHTRENLDRQYAESNALVGTHLRVYQIHSATPESGVLENPEVLARLAELRDAGIVIGVSTSGPDQATTIRRALEIEIDGRLLFGTVQATWNLLESSAGEALAEAADAGIGVIVKEAVANGRLTVRNQAMADRLRAAAPEWSPDALAIAAGLHQPWSSVVLSGAATAEQLTSNLQALEVPRAVTDQLPTIAESPDAYWRTRGALPWQ
ncbi:MAG: aldo/keto reductase, partial [Acidimicrobiia bacterium]|nr:aldo/keto reductase [Acidimicrobiia bacterium]